MNDEDKNNFDVNCTISFLNKCLYDEENWMSSLCKNIKTKDFDLILFLLDKYFKENIDSQFQFDGIEEKILQIKDQSKKIRSIRHEIFKIRKENGRL